MSNKASNCGCCAFKNSILVLLGCLFMVAMSYIYAALLALPLSFLVLYFVPDVFGSFGQAYFCVTMSFAILFIGITVLSRLAQLTLDDAYLSETYFYEFSRNF
ncbi:MAG: hypothetical protein OCC45_13220 [Desulfotalea sp.]